jgi:hypothetical protein
MAWECSTQRRGEKWLQHFFVEKSEAGPVVILTRAFWKYNILMWSGLNRLMIGTSGGLF